MLESLAGGTTLNHPQVSTSMLVNECVFSEGLDENSLTNLLPDLTSHDNCCEEGSAWCPPYGDRAAFASVHSSWYPGGRSGLAKV